MWEAFAEEVEVLEPLPGEAFVERYPEKRANLVLTSHRLMVRDSAAVRTYDRHDIRDVRLETVRNPAALALAWILFGLLAAGVLAYWFNGDPYVLLPLLVVGPFLLLGGLIALVGGGSRSLVVETSAGKDSVDARTIAPDDLRRLQARLNL